MDTNNRGKINIDELRVGLHKLGHQVPDSDVQILMEAVSTNFYYIAPYLEPFLQNWYLKKYLLFIRSRSFFAYFPFNMPN